MKRNSDRNSGTVRTVRSRKTGEVIGYQAILPHELSTKPERSTDTRYREPIGPLQPTEAAARRILDVTIVEKRDKRTLRHGLPLAEYVASEIKDRHQKAMRSGLTETQANLSVSTWRSIAKVWLKDANFYQWPPGQIERADLQHWFKSVSLAKRAGKPLSGNFIRNIAALLRAAFDLAEVPANPAIGLDLPEKNKPKVPHLDLEQQMALFGCRDIPLADRVMIGCGMGAGLRVGELLSIERGQVSLHSAGPHLIVRYGGKDRAPTKGRKDRRVELFEPGLGFWKMWMRSIPPRSSLVFLGPKDGYLAKWPESFQRFGELAGLEALTSHYMRHSYAVSMLSGSWGYEPRTLEFVQAQLGHSEIQTTERYYGAFVVGTWTREAQRMTGEISNERRDVITAANLLQEPGVLPVGKGGTSV